MDLSFLPETAHLQMSSGSGINLSYSLKLKTDSETFSLKSGASLRECFFHLTVHPLSQSPYRDRYEADARLGEISPLLYSPPEANRHFTVWLHIPDDQFNTLLFETSKQNLPESFVLGVNNGFDDEELGGLSELVWNDIYLPGRGDLPVRHFLFVVNLVKRAAVAA